MKNLFGALLITIALTSSVSAQTFGKRIPFIKATLVKSGTSGDAKTFINIVASYCVQIKSEQLFKSCLTESVAYARLSDSPIDGISYASGFTSGNVNYNFAKVKLQADNNYEALVK